MKAATRVQKVTKYVVDGKEFTDKDEAHRFEIAGECKAKIHAVLGLIPGRDMKPNEVINAIYDNRVEIKDIMQAYRFRPLFPAKVKMVVEQEKVEVGQEKVSPKLRKTA